MLPLYEVQLTHLPKQVVLTMPQIFQQLTLDERKSVTRITHPHVHTSSAQTSVVSKQKFSAKESEKVANAYRNQRKQRDREIEGGGRSKRMNTSSWLTFHFSGFISAFLSWTTNAELAHTFSEASPMQMKVHCPIKLLDERIKWNRTAQQHWL